MGIAALAASPAPGGTVAQRARALGVAVRFAVGHAVLLAAGAGALILLGWSLPLAVERGGEMLGGALLITLGIAALPHWHARGGRHTAPHVHSHLPTIIGAAFAISSLRALTMLAPFGEHVESASLPQLLLLVAIFAVGILLSMSLFGVAFARLMSTSAIRRLGRASAVAMASASVALGGYWIYAAI